MSITPLKLLAILAGQLDQLKGRFALAGGLAASLYRKQPRVTNDIDILIDCSGVETSKAEAIRFLNAENLKTSFGWISDARERLESSVIMVRGHADGDEYGAAIDFLLPVFPWVDNALTRAQENRILIAGQKLPTLTPEDLIISKAYALTLSPNRFQDLDDIQAILNHQHDLDVCYLVAEFEKLELSLPKNLVRSLSQPLKRALKARRT